MERSRIRKIIKEEIGRNFKTIDNNPFQFDDYVDYDMEMTGNTLDGFYLTIYYKNNKVLPTTKFKDHDECKHFGRVFIDKHRVWSMNQEN